MQFAVGVDERVRTKRNPGAGAGLKGAFTRYVRALEPWGEPGVEAFDELWQALRAALAHELRKRSLWTTSPSYVGVYGWESWEMKASGGAESALDELAADCYAFIFVRRLPRLRIHLEKKPDVEGLVFLLIRNYLHDRQRHHDPLGFRVFEVLRIAVREAVAAGELVVLEGDDGIRNETILATGTTEDPREVAEPAVFAPIVERWNEELLPDLVTAVGPARPPLVARLRRRLFDFEAEGVRAFRFKALIDALKNDVRMRWAAIFDFEAGESVREDDENGFATAVRLFQPDRRCEETESFEKLVSCITDRLEKLDEPERTLHYLRTLWGFLRHYASGQGPERLPSNRKLAGLLHIPRERFPSLYETLGRLARRCEDSFSKRGAVIDGRGRFTGADRPARPGRSS